jgi:hypothetical protein
MTTPQFVEWLDRKTAPFEQENPKVVPPQDVVSDRLRKEVKRLVRERETERALREANLDGLVRAGLSRLGDLGEVAATVWAGLPGTLRGTDRWWATVVDEEAGRLAGSKTGPESRRRSS